MEDTTNEALYPFSFTIILPLTSGETTVWKGTCTSFDDQRPQPSLHTTTTDSVEHLNRKQATMEDDGHNEKTHRGIFQPNASLRTEQRLEQPRRLLQQTTLVQVDALQPQDANPQEMLVRLYPRMCLAIDNLINIPPRRHKPTVQKLGLVGGAPDGKLAGEVFCSGC